jgi:hypothetical protein
MLPCSHEIVIRSIINCVVLARNDVHIMCYVVVMGSDHVLVTKNPTEQKIAGTENVLWAIQFFLNREFKTPILLDHGSNLCYW